MASLELQWMGYYLVREAVLEPEQVREVAADLDDDVDFVDYAQAVVDSGLTDEVEVIQNLVDQAFTAGQEGESPPVNIFTPPPPAEPPKTPEPDTADDSHDRPPLRLRMQASSEQKPPVTPDENEGEADGGAFGSHPRPRPKPLPLKLRRDAANEAPSGHTAKLKGVRSQLKKLESAAAGKNEPESTPEPEEDVKSLRPKLRLKSEDDAEPTPPPTPPVATPAPAKAPPAPKPRQASPAPGRNGESAPIPSISSIAGKPMPAVNSAAGKSRAEAGQLLGRLLLGARERGASDLHLSAAARPFMRVNLVNQYLEDEPLDPAASEALNLALLNEEQREEFDQELDLDYLLALDDENRFRVNLMRHRTGVAGTYRLVPNTIHSLTDLGFQNADVISKLLDHHNGLILVTGPVGCGKTTTLASLVNMLNKRRQDHVICVEDPIEIVQMSRKCNVTQREVGKHTKNFASALKGALREDPDIIVIGEMRDLETIEMAITAAETGHLVIGTLHTSDAATTLNRVLDVFPPSQQAQIRSMTAESLRGVICQKQVPTVTGGIAIAEELLIGTIAVSNIIREGRMYQLKGVLQTGSKVGMVTMDQSIYRLYTEGEITVATALANISDSELTRRITGMEEKAQAAAAAAEADGKKKKGWFR